MPASRRVPLSRCLLLRLLICLFYHVHNEEPVYSPTTPGLSRASKITSPPPCPSQRIPTTRSRIPIDLSIHGLRPLRSSIPSIPSINRRKTHDMPPYPHPPHVIPVATTSQPPRQHVLLPYRPYLARPPTVLHWHDDLNDIPHLQ